MSDLRVGFVVSVDVSTVTSPTVAANGSAMRSAGFELQTFSLAPT